MSSRSMSTTSARKPSKVGYAARERCVDQKFAQRLGLGSVIFGMRTVRARRNTNSSTDKCRLRRSFSTTPSPAGRSIVRSPTVVESPRQSPHRNAFRSHSPRPLTDSANWLWKERRRCSPSVTTGRPAPSWSLIASSTARSSRALNRACEIRSEATSSRAETSSGGRSRLPTASAWQAITGPDKRVKAIDGAQ